MHNSVNPSLSPRYMGNQGSGGVFRMTNSSYTSPVYRPPIDNLSNAATELIDPRLRF